MSRKPFEQEREIREAIRRKIAENRLTDFVAYPRPDAMQKILAQKGIVVSRQTIWRMYKDMGINDHNGAWLRRLKAAK